MLPSLPIGDAESRLIDWMSLGSSLFTGPASLITCSFLCDWLTTYLAARTFLAAMPGLTSGETPPFAIFSLYSVILSMLGSRTESSSSSLNVYYFYFGTFITWARSLLIAACGNSLSSLLNCMLGSRRLLLSIFSMLV